MIPKVVRLWIVALLAALLTTFAAAVPAMAAPVSPAQTGSVAHAIGNKAISNTVTSQICGAGDNSWVHMTINGQTYCFTGTGDYYFQGNVTGWFCADTRYGTVYYDNSSGRNIPLGYT